MLNLVNLSYIIYIFGLIHNLRNISGFSVKDGTIKREKFKSIMLRIDKHIYKLKTDNIKQYKVERIGGMMPADCLVLHR